MSIFDSRIVERTKENIQKQESYRLEEVTELVMNFQTADIFIMPSEDDKLTVIQYASKKIEDNKLFRTHIDGEKLYIEDVVKLFAFGFKKTAVEIYLPKSYANKLAISGISGEISFNQEINCKELLLSSTSGNIEVKQAVAAGIAEITTVSGEIEIGILKTETNKLKSTSGKIEVKELEGNCSVNTVSGEVDVRRLIGKASIKTTSGDIDIKSYYMKGESTLSSTSGEIRAKLDKESNVTIETKTMSGKVKLPNDTSIIGVEPRSTLSIHTVSGRIEIE